MKKSFVHGREETLALPRKREREREETLPLGRTGWEVVGVVPVPLPSQQIT
jgi:hypothetical protein